ncbi:MAG TPA: hypothetical protein VF605_19505 [Allosphingosinicella sp.]|jgi:hypothetical protein
MLSHIAEETTRLSHGFLGALFSFMIIVADSNFWTVAILCFAMYVAFVMNTSALHLVFRLAVQGLTDRALWMVLLFIGETIVVAGLFFVYWLNMEEYFAPKYALPLQFGMTVYAAFIGLMNLSHLVEIFDLKKRRTALAGATA